MESIKVYRNLNIADKLFGLELADGAIMLLAFFVIFMVNREGLFTNAVLLVALYFGLRALKRGKPDGYMLILVRFLLMSRYKRRTDFEEAEVNG
jgi:hypothetical protein